MSALREEEKALRLGSKSNSFSHFNAITKDILCHPLPLQSDILKSELQSLLNQATNKQSIEQLASIKTRNASSCTDSQDKTILSSIEFSTSTLKDATPIQLLALPSLKILPIKIRSKINESIFKRGVIKPKIKLYAPLNKKCTPSKLNIALKPMKESDEGVLKVVTSKVRNVTQKNKVVQPETTEITISIRLKKRQSQHEEGMKRNKRGSASCSDITQSKDNMKRFTDQFKHTQSSFKFLLESIDGSSLDFLSMKQTMGQLKGNHRGNSSNENIPERYPLYFLPDLAQGLLEQTHDNKY